MKYLYFIRLIVIVIIIILLSYNYKLLGFKPYKPTNKVLQEFIKYREQRSFQSMKNKIDNFIRKASRKPANIRDDFKGIMQALYDRLDKLLKKIETKSFEQLNRDDFRDNEFDRKLTLKYEAVDLDRGYDKKFFNEYFEYVTNYLESYIIDMKNAIIFEKSLGSNQFPYKKETINNFKLLHQYLDKKFNIICECVKCP